MNVKDVKIEDVEILENIRGSEADSEIPQLMESIKQHGLKEPIGVGETASGKYILLYGFRRMTACKKLGWVLIPAVIEKEPDTKVLLILNAIENLQRKDNTPQELGRICLRLVELKMSVSEIAVNLGIPSSRVAMALRIFKKIPASIREKITFMGAGATLKKGQLPASVAHHNLSAAKKYYIPKKLMEELCEYSRVAELTGNDIMIISALIKAGLSPIRAIEERKKYKSVRTDIIVSKEEISHLSNKAKLTETKYLEYVCYGEAKVITRPKFYKQ